MNIRPSFATQVDRTTRYLSDLKNQVERAARVATNQLEVLDPSDAPGAWTQLHALDDRLRDQSVWISNSRSVQAALGAAEGAIGQGTNLLTEARELTVQAASETLTDDDRAQIASRIDGIREAIIGLGNTTMSGRSLFAGTAFDSDAFDASGAYLGNAAEGSTLVADDRSVRSSLVGGDVFSDALATLADLSVALRSGAGSADAAAAELANLDTARETMVRARQGIGFDLIDADDAAALADSMSLTLQQSLNDRVAADPFEALTAVSELQSTYEVALQVTANVSSTTLFDFLR